MKAVKPDIIRVSIKMYGNEGPLGQQTGYAPSFAAIGGLNYLVGHEGEAPRGMNIRYGDTTVGAAAAFGAIAALHHRERTGEGQFVDVSAVEALSGMVADQLFAFAVTGERPRHAGNFHPELSPHGVYPCADGGWISIACDGDEDWRFLAAALGDAGLGEAPEYADHARRLAHRSALDAAIARLTSGRDAGELAAELRAHGLAAYASASSLALACDEWAWARPAFHMVENGNGDTRPVVGASWRFAPDGITPHRGAPLLGEHDDYVYRELLGLPEAEYERLKANGAIS
jgi:crotonobetainyl-CoA:carnitine CoA-transferase CaiB-like acyl-CoA transferase